VYDVCFSKEMSFFGRFKKNNIDVENHVITAG